MSEQNDDLVYLSIAADSDSGELVKRSQLPNDAFLGGGDIDGRELDGLPESDEPRWYQEYVVER